MSVLAPTGGSPLAASERPGRIGGWLAFCALALYGTLRWDTMLEGSERHHVLGALGLAVLSAAVVCRAPARRLLIPLIVLVDLILVFVIAGFPLSWLIHGHLGRVAVRLDHGISTIPSVLVPYRGGDPATVAVIALGGGALLICAGLLYGAVRERPATEPLALVALPLVVLAVVPSTIVAPRLAPLHGLVTFALVVTLIFVPRMDPRRGGGAVLLCLLAALLGAVAVGVIEGNHPWVRYANGTASTTGGGSGGDVVARAGNATEHFSWRQGYGPLGPQSDETVLSITAPRPAYWKAEDLDDFNGRAWTSGSSDVGGNPLSGVSAAHLARYRERLSVHVDAMTSPEIITAGSAGRPDALGAEPGSTPGTWITDVPLTPGTAYGVSVYAPDPTPAELAGAGRRYPPALAALTQLRLSGSDRAELTGLAQRLAAGTSTPIAEVEAVMAYLSPAHGFHYTLFPPPGGADPLVRFLFDTRAGYCQQFAGAMALLLRLDGIPARVAVGFGPGQRRTHGDTYDVASADAHAWVEAWFPTWGWVTFDPTPGRPSDSPAGQPVDQASAALTAGQTGSGAAAGPLGSQSWASEARDQPAGSRARGARDATAARARGGEGGGDDGLGVGAIAALALAVAALGLLVATALGAGRLGLWRRPGPGELAAELERAFARCGQPLAPGTTLAELERRVAEAPEAAGYLRALGLERYGRPGGGQAPRGRAALRRWLATHSGRAGRLRAFWALPPRRTPGT